MLGWATGTVACFDRRTIEVVAKEADPSVGSGTVSLASLRAGRQSWHDCRRPHAKVFVSSSLSSSLLL